MSIKELGSQREIYKGTGDRPAVNLHSRYRYVRLKSDRAMMFSYIV